MHGVVVKRRSDINYLKNKHDFGRASINNAIFEMYLKILRTDCTWHDNDIQVVTYNSTEFSN